MLLQNLAILIAAAPSVLGFIQITSPAAGDSFQGGKPISIAWKDSGDDPPVASLDSYSLYLHAGGNTPGTFQQVGDALASHAVFPLSNSINGSVPIDAGASIDNAYFLQMISTSLEGGTITTYSPRFSLTGMTGTFPPAIERAARHITGTHSLETQNDIVRREADPQGAAPVAPAAAAPAAPAAPAGVTASFALAYGEQDGPTKYAPMMGRPGTKITAVSASLQYPTSSYSVFKSNLPPGKQKTTTTMAPTFTASSHENSATPAALPQDAMQKYLARWRD